jgi:hypothetical protein
VAGLCLLNLGVTTKKAAFLWMWLSYTLLEALLIAVILISVYFFEGKGSREEDFY